MVNSNKFSKIGKANSKNGQENGLSHQYICTINNLKNWIKMKAKIEIKELPELDLAYNYTNWAQRNAEFLFKIN